MIRKVGMAEQKIRDGHYWLAITGSVVLQAVVIMYFTTGSFQRIDHETMLGAGVVLAVVIVLVNLVPVGLKERLVFWRLWHPLPSNRVFSKLMDSDPRIDVENVRSKINPLPTDPSEQNRIWYGIYKKQRYEPIIFQLNQRFLILRDITGLFGLMAAGFVVNSLVGKTHGPS